MNKYHMHDFSIFLHQIEGKWYEFGYYEYTGDDFDADMAKLDAEPRTRSGTKSATRCRPPMPGEKGWAKMERVYYNP